MKTIIYNPNKLYTSPRSGKTLKLIEWIDFWVKPYYWFTYGTTTEDDNILLGVFQERLDKGHFIETSINKEDSQTID